MPGSPGLSPGSVIHSEDSQASAYSHTYAMIHRSKRTQHDQQRGGTWGEVQGCPAQLPEPSPRGITQDMLIAPAGRWDSTSCVPAKLIREAPRLLSGAGHQSAAPAWNLPTSQTPQKNAGVRQKPGRFVQFGLREPLPTSRFPAKGSPVSEQAVSGLLRPPCSAQVAGKLSRN